MTAYEICYLEEDGSLACAFSVQFESEMRAKILAHAMKPAHCHTLEVWHGQGAGLSPPEIGTVARPLAARLLAERHPVIA
ncbi:MAG: hypothetical protein WDM81_01020 [Rhizomicrobium sp.]